MGFFFQVFYFYPLFCCCFFIFSTYHVWDNFFHISIVPSKFEAYGSWGAQLMFVVWTKWFEDLLPNSAFWVSIGCISGRIFTLPTAKILYCHQVPNIYSASIPLANAVSQDPIFPSNCGLKGLKGAFIQGAFDQCVVFQWLKVLTCAPIFYLHWNRDSSKNLWCIKSTVTLSLHCHQT